jgi:hypothetical protein
MKLDTSLRTVKKKIKSEFGSRMDLKWIDTDGDHIHIRKESHWKGAVAATPPGGTLKLNLSQKQRAAFSSAETMVLETLVDGIIIIDTKCKSFFFNFNFFFCFKLISFKLIKFN